MTEAHGFFVKDGAVVFYDPDTTPIAAVAGGEWASVVRADLIK